MAALVDEVVDLVGKIQILKNQVADTSNKVQEQAEETSNQLKTSFEEIEKRVDAMLDKLKGLTRITNSHYLSVAGGAFCFGVALALLSCFAFSNWINKDIIETRAELKIEQEQLEKREAKIAAVESKYERFDRYDNLLVLFDKFNAKDKDAVSIYSGTNYLEKTLKDTTEDVLVLKVKSDFLSECADDKQKCYADPANKDGGYFGVGAALKGSYFLISLKKEP